MESKFRIKGRALVNTMALLDRLPGGKQAVIDRIPESDHPYYEDIFLESGWYDFFPYERLMTIVGDLRGMSLREVMKEQSLRTARLDVSGIYRLSLDSSSPFEMAKRLPRAFNRYFQPCEAVLVDVEQTHARFELLRIPETSVDFFYGVNEGFVIGALRQSGAPNPRVHYAEPQRGETIDGIATLTLPFDARW